MHALFSTYRTDSVHFYSFFSFLQKLHHKKLLSYYSSSLVNSDDNGQLDALENATPLYMQDFFFENCILQVHLALAFNRFKHMYELFSWWTFWQGASTYEEDKVSLIFFLELRMVCYYYFKYFIILVFRSSHNFNVLIDTDLFLDFFSSDVLHLWRK